ncbi:MAG: glycosyltransferase [Gemmatimonadales bacterium]
MKGVSVVICSYNSRGKLPETLRHLAIQLPVPDVPYELIIVDNNCTDDTLAVAENHWTELGAPFPLRFVTEPRPGLTFARIKGVQLAALDYVVFCDDDNWLCEDYLSKTYRHFESKKEIALLGGVGVPEFEAQPPDWFNAVKGFGYAVGDEGRQTGYVTSLYGAGMALRKSAFLQVINKNGLSVSDRNGSQLFSGGDTEISQVISKAGYRIYLDCSMTFKHFLPKNRLTWSYYLQLRRSFGVATANLQLTDTSGKTSNRGILADFISVMNYCLSNLKYTLFSSQLKTAQCANFVQQRAWRTTLIRARHR